MFVYTAGRRWFSGTGQGMLPGSDTGNVHQTSSGGNGLQNRAQKAPGEMGPKTASKTDRGQFGNW